MATLPINGTVAANGNVLRWQTNVPETIALAFANGKPVEGQYGDQVMFTLDDGRKTYLAPFVADRIAELGIRAHQEFTICKAEVKQGSRKAINWIITPPAGAQPAAHAEETTELERTLRESVEAINRVNAAKAAEAKTAAAPLVKLMSIAAGAPEAPTPQPSNMMRTCLLATIDAVIAGEAHAKAHGLAIEFGPEDIRAMAISYFIQMGQMGGRHA